MEAVLKAELRKEIGSRSCRQLREAGSVPAVLYGKGKEVQHLSLSSEEVKEYFAKIAQQECNLDISGESQKVSIADVQRHPISRNVQHLDFIRN